MKIISSEYVQNKNHLRHRIILIDSFPSRENPDRGKGVLLLFTHLSCRISLPIGQTGSLTQGRMSTMNYFRIGYFSIVKPNFFKFL